MSNDNEKKTDSPIKGPQALEAARVRRATEETERQRKVREEADGKRAATAAEHAALIAKAERLGSEFIANATEHDLGAAEWCRSFARQNGARKSNELLGPDEALTRSFPTSVGKALGITVEDVDNKKVDWFPVLAFARAVLAAWPDTGTGR